MGFDRETSIDPIKMDQWRWSPFLNYAIQVLSPLGIESYPMLPKFLQVERNFGSKSNLSNAITNTWACKTKKLKQVRAACVDAGTSAAVLNLVINPSPSYDLPFFGADLVTLPSGHLLALDFQPVLNNDAHHLSLIVNRLIPLFDRWQSHLPDGGPIPEEAKSFFSPGFLWTRLPLNSESDKLINSVIMTAFRDYLDLYIELVKEAEQVTAERFNLLLDGQKRYLLYRAKKDPARGMLTRFYGSEWTESYINNVLFSI